MNDGKMIQLNGKTVQVSQPYRPALREDDELVGRDQEARMVLAAWIGQLIRPTRSTEIRVLPGVVVEWGALAERLPKPE